MGNVQIIIPENSAQFSPKIQSPDPQRTLGLGPTGVIHKPKIPDNKAFWESVNAVEFSSRGSSRRDVYRSVAWHVSLTDERVCFASVGTIAERAGLKATATRSQLRALERDGYIEVEGGRGGGRSSTRYRLTDKRLSTLSPTLSVAHPNAQRCPPQRSALPKKVIEEVLKKYKQQRPPIVRTNSQPLFDRLRRCLCS